MNRRAPYFARFFFVLLLTTEAFYIDFFGGIVRPYHFLIPLALLLYAPGISRRFSSKVAQAALALLTISIAAAAVSPDPGAAFKSLSLFGLNMGISFAVAAMAASGRFSFGLISEIFRKITITMIVFALLQFAAFQVGGIVLALSDQQSRQIAAGFAPGFFNEANGLAKYIVTPFFFFFPVMVRHGVGRQLLALYILIILVFMLNFMRSAGIAISVTLVFTVFWYTRLGLFSAIAKRLSSFLVLGTLVIISLIYSGSFAEYTAYKFSVLFDVDAISTDGSLQFRSASMFEALQQTLSDPTRIAMGNGWGQVYGFVGGQVRQIGGPDLLNIFAYDGLLGVAGYIGMIAMAVRAATRHARNATTAEERIFGEGVMFSLVANFVLGMISGVMLLASFWILIGLAMAFCSRGVRHQQIRQSLAGRPYV